MSELVLDNDTKDKSNRNKTAYVSFSSQNTEPTNRPTVQLNETINTHHEPNIENVSYDQLQHLSGIGPEEVEYKMDYKIRGKVLIFNHNTYDNKQIIERHGTEVDKKTIQSTFEHLGFQVDAYDDLACKELQSTAIAVAAEDHSNRSCLVVVVMTHGEEGGVLAAKDQEYNTEVLLSCFFAGRCPTMTGKPKIFIIQACRGDSVSAPFNIQYDTRLATTSRFYSIPGEADVLLAFSTYAGCKSHRDANQGSWFIQELCKELSQNSNKLDMVSMLTNVTRHVAIEKEYLKGKQVPVMQSTLTRKLYLHPATPPRKIQHVSMVHPQETVEHDPISIKSYKTRQEITTELVYIRNIELPDIDVVMKLGNGLKLFLQKMPLPLTKEVQDSGEEILLWVSRWDILDQTLRCHTYKKLLRYLQSNAREWECYNLLYIPKY